ncbi:MAG: hypothetical protein PUA93_04310 [Eubacteriales bacterium]|nr:hypothetical protein [Eubacteriales bacterium]
MKKNLLSILLLSFVALASCSSKKGDPLPPVSDSTIEVNKDTAYEIDNSFLKANENTLTGNKEDDVKAYFVSYATKLTYTATGTESNDSYIFSQKQTLKNREFAMRLTYLYADETKKDTPFRLVSEWHLDSEDSLPNAYYYYSVDFAFEDFKTVTLSSSYCYDYEDSKKKETEYLTCPITYDNVSYGTAPEFKKATFHIGSLDDFPSSAKKQSDSEMGASAFECIRVATAFAESILQAVSKDYHLW